MTAAACTSAAWTCSTARPFSTSNPTCRAYRPANQTRVAGGRRGPAGDRRPCRDRSDTPPGCSRPFLLFLACRALESLAFANVPESPMVGTTLGHYRIERALGSGGMGDVYLADDTTLHRKVALKVLSGRIAADHRAVLRFQREAEAVAALNHPGIVTIHSVEEDNGIHFLTMEVVEGQPLSLVIRAGDLPLLQALETAIQLADAVDAAHRRGIIHRDIKPGNVIEITKSGVKMLDFGLAKLTDSSPPADLTQQSITMTGFIVGTPQYWRRSRSIAGRSTIARTFSRSVPSELRDDHRPAGVQGQRVVKRHRGRADERSASNSESRPDAPRALDTIVMKCLAKHPDDRRQSVRDLREVLQMVREAAWPDASALAASTPGARASSSRRWILRRRRCSSRWDSRSPPSSRTVRRVDPRPLRGRVGRSDSRSRPPPAHRETWRCRPTAERWRLSRRLRMHRPSSGCAASPTVKRGCFQSQRRHTAILVTGWPFDCLPCR